MIIKKYFSPNDEIWNIVDNIIHKYNIDYDNTCVIFYRGNDKCTEMCLGNPDDFGNKAIELKNKYPNLRFLVQSDETDFIELMHKYIEDPVILYDEIRHIRKTPSATVDKLGFDNYKYSKFFLAIILIMSKCKFLICNSGNNSVWVYFFRHIYNKQNACNVLQWQKDNWHTINHL